MKYALLFFILVCLCLPALAQEATREPTAEATTSAPVLDSPTSTATVVTENNALKIIVAGITFYIAGMASTLAGIAAFVRVIMANPLWMRLAEWIGGKTLTPIVGRSVHTSLNTIGEFVENISDDIAEADKPRLMKITYSDGTTYNPNTGVFTHLDGSTSHDLVHRPSMTGIDPSTLPSSSTFMRPVPGSDKAV